MGYCVHLSGQKFFLHSSKIDECISNILSNKKLASEIVAAKRSIKYFDNIPAIFQLVEMVNELWGFKFVPNKHGAIDKVLYELEKMHDHDGFCNAVAPYVESGSYLEFRGEDSAMWRYLFKDNTWTKVVPKVVWPE